ncbi:MAG TPA: metal ABC transporter substrate-binding protein [Bacillota bacterium]|nr:metal ABC transporter substrate-binding protein [Bacillota bacterium]
MKIFSTNWIAGLLTALLLFTQAGCADRSEPNSHSIPTNRPAGLRVVTSFYPIYIMTLNVTRNIPGVEVTNMTPPQSGCLHDYQLTPDDLTKLAKAQVLIINGAGMESFVDRIRAQQPQLKIVEAAKGLTPIKNTSDGEPNPHIWVSLTGAIQEVENIGGQLAALDPIHADQYRANTAEYVSKLDQLRQKMHRSLAGVANRNIVTFHEAFPYFAREFNLKVAAVVEREPGSQPSAGELAETIQLVKESRVSALFAEPQYAAKAAETIARETGSSVYQLDPGVSGRPDADAYLEIMNHNLRVLEEALKK